jgi:hypothetical protein
MTAPVLAESADCIALLTFDRPGWLNAINVETAEAFADAIETALREPSVRVILLSAEGCAFVAGGGLASFQSAERLAAGAPAPMARTKMLMRDAFTATAGAHLDAEQSGFAGALPPRTSPSLFRQAQHRFTGR